MNVSKMKYTIKHRKYYRIVAKELGVFKPRHYLHDLDKLILLFFTKPKHNKKISNFHRNYSRHHDNNKNKTRNDYIDMIIDWECARFTKPDKPLNARDTLNKYYNHLWNDIAPILNELNL